MSIEELIRRYEAGGGRLAKASAEGLAVPPALHTVVLTCMDSRLDVFALFGLKMGEVHVLRNAGGVVTDDVVRSLTISQRKLQTREILLMQHAGCGLGTFTDEDFSEELADEVGMRPPWRTHAFRDPRVSVRRDMAQLRHNPFLLPGTRIRGFVVDIETFDLEEVFVEEGAPSVVRTPALGTPAGQLGSSRPGEHGAVVAAGDVVHRHRLRGDPTADEDVVDLRAQPPRRAARPGAHQPLPGPLGRVGASRRRGAEDRVVEGAVEVARDDHRAGLRVRAPAADRRQVAAPLRYGTGGGGDGVEGDEPQGAQPAARDRRRRGIPSSGPPARRRRPGRRGPPP